MLTTAGIAARAMAASPVSSTREHAGEPGRQSAANAAIGTNSFRMGLSLTGTSDVTSAPQPRRLNAAVALSMLRMMAQRPSRPEPHPHRRANER
jgi:hypothetical protein